jgi:Ca2+-binding RTX toxin-like protein
VVATASGNVSHKGWPHTRHTFIAGPGGGVLRGTSGNDLLLGGAGSDTIYGDAGYNVVYGGPGNDHIFGYFGHGRIDCGPGHDVVTLSNLSAYKTVNCEVVRKGVP